MSAQRFSTQISGEVLHPGTPDFDEFRSLWNVRLDRRPEIVVRCKDTADIKACLDFSRQAGLKVSIKGGGHSYAANTVVDGGLLIDLSLMKSVRVDAESSSVLVQPGVTCGELDRVTQEHGLAMPLPTVSSVGVAGAVLGGGSGYLSREYGLTLDNLIAAELVTADGRRVRASGEENTDLFWALRGAGANFGVATSFQFQLHRVGPEVLAGQIVYPFDNAGELLRFFRSFMADAPETFQCYPFMFRVPPIDPFPPRFHGHLALDFVLFHRDPSAVDFVQPLRTLGETVLDFVGPLPYITVQSSFDAGLPRGQRYYSKAHYLDKLSEAAIDTIVEHVPGMQGSFSLVYLEPLDGAIARVGPLATAFHGRHARYSFHILAGWTEAAQDESTMAWARNFHQAMTPHATGGVYVNLLAEDEQDRIPAAYGDNFRRLRQLKSGWDPENLFRGNHNIRPAS
jgi:FAD/FMN-containing dehydrogenase